MTTNVPPITWNSATGFQVPSSAAVLTGVQADITAAFGTALNFNLNTPQGQLASTEAAVIINTNAIFLYYTQQVDPSFATGRMQDAIGRIYFLERLPSEPTVLTVNCTGTGVTIPVGATIIDPSNNIYLCTGAVQLPAGGGTVSAQFAAQIPGPLQVPPSVSIYQTINGWDSVTLVSGVVGQNTETRAQFEARRAQSVAQNSIGSLPSILGAVLSVAGVLDAYVTENTANTSASIGGVTLAANSVYVAAVGGTDLAVATAIWSKKAPGCNYNGNTTISVQDTSAGYSPPYPTYSVTFERPPSLRILFAVNIVSSVEVPANAATLIQNAIISAFAGGDGGARARIGSTIYALRYAAPVASLGAWAQIRALTIGSNNSPTAVVVGSVSGTTMTVASVTSGTLHVGDTLSDAAGDFPSGCTILSQTSGPAGGTGTYTISNTLTVGGGTTITAAAASAASVSVNINQEPTIAAADIVVTVS